MPVEILLSVMMEDEINESWNGDVAGVRPGVIGFFEKQAPIILLELPQLRVDPQPLEKRKHRWPGAVRMLTELETDNCQPTVMIIAYKWRILCLFSETPEVGTFPYLRKIPHSSFPSPPCEIGCLLA